MTDETKASYDELVAANKALMARIVLAESRNDNKDPTPQSLTSTTVTMAAAPSMPECFLGMVTFAAEVKRLQDDRPLQTCILSVLTQVRAAVVRSATMGSPTMTSVLERYTLAFSSKTHALKNELRHSVSSTLSTMKKKNSDVASSSSFKKILILFDSPDTYGLTQSILFTLIEQLFNLDVVPVDNKSAKAAIFVAATRALAPLQPPVQAQSQPLQPQLQVQAQPQLAPQLAQLKAEHAELKKTPRSISTKQRDPIPSPTPQSSASKLALVQKHKEKRSSSATKKRKPDARSRDIGKPVVYDDHDDNYNSDSDEEEIAKKTKKK